MQGFKRRISDKVNNANVDGTEHLHLATVTQTIK